VRFHKRLFFGVGFLILLGNGHAIAAPVERSVSSSRQFIVYGVTTQLRGAVAEVAEETKATVLNALRVRDEWKIPIILNLQFPQANVPEIPAAALRFSQTGSGLKIQLDLTIPSEFDVLMLRRQLLRTTLLEMIYRQVPDLPAGSFYVEPPEWLIEALLATNPLQDRTPIIDAVQPLIAGHKIASLEEFLRQRIGLLDSSGQIVYRAYSLAFLRLLLNEPGVAARLTNYISTLSKASSDPLADLKAQFPVLAGDGSVDALWKESVASLETFDYELLTPAQTQGELDALVGSGTGAKLKGDATNLAKLSQHKVSRSEKVELRQLKEKLILLGVRANPMLRPLVFEYEQIVEQIMAHKLRKIATRLARVSSQRERFRNRMTDIDDYMNWFEATQSNTLSGAFRGYLRAAAQSDEPPSRRRDPLSVYLDALEAQF
jgi:hypothetical protein